MVFRRGLFWIACILAATPVSAEVYFVKDQKTYFAAEKKLVAGDTIVLANGVWKDFEIKFSGKGTKAKPITLRPQNAGKVILSGQSNLRIGGRYMIVAGLVFKNGYSPTGEVISFRRSKQDLAYHSRVTNVVIDHFSKPDRYESDYWVGMYGKHNRFDHNHLVGKTNKGVTFAVRLDSSESQENYHRIDHNYFGPRPVLGSNGGETLRIGTSKYSMFNSHTTVENNYFDRCDGEVEIISSKAGQNVFRGNVFFESSGTLTLRHGDGNLVENNVFFGNGKDHTGGIRVINRDQTVRNNYMEGLRGTGFASALTVMNGVPNSPVNRYVEVSNATIENNSVVDSSRITFSAGADTERSAAPVDSRFRDNLLTGTDSGTFIKIQDDISGIAFADNLLSKGRTEKPVQGISETDVALVRAENGLLYPEGLTLGASRDLKPVTREEVGVKWYAKPPVGGRFGTGKAIAVAPGEDSLTEAFATAADGDQLVLAAGDYLVNKVLPLDKTVSIEGPKDGVATISFARPSLVEIRQGGSLRLSSLTIDGGMAPDSVGNAVIRTTIFPIQSNFLIDLDGVNVTNLDVNRSFHVISLGKSSFADRVSIKNSNFLNISGSILQAAAETEDYGQYNAEYIEISGSSFQDIGGEIFNVYRGGRDESTFGPHFSLTGSNFLNVGLSKNNITGASMVLHGVQHADISGNNFLDAAPIKIVHTVGRPQTRISGNKSANMPEPILEELNFEGAHRAILSGNQFEGAVKP
ncbi:poly(beta-D-mannuronate) lyase [Parasphingorhabdus marina DSM 22363]|uniref:Poly(Beta-D-mannuronate) lyase n=1 Tax=Parasphingorhabdus marina DSM 22363 TaxID=1123272 RepID=A0A1N6EHA1_9SPHN|nr:polysaccharide lyase 6 family protein [Parasphingorhabdus marina]SIN82360.1 poly(beta-D-mannuronate) lyase [Parasphingorhabdus marina DSM 22363]